jgi:hypothetical protein
MSEVICNEERFSCAHCGGSRALPVRRWIEQPSFEQLAAGEASHYRVACLDCGIRTAWHSTLELAVSRWTATIRAMSGR